MQKILILYSNPGETERIRLDKEHRAVDEVIRARGSQSFAVVRRHAATFKDLTNALGEAEYSVFHFSGHGEADGICLESDRSEEGEMVTAERIAHLVAGAQPKLNLAIFLSCFSASAIPTLLRTAPYLITVYGPADDAAAVAFVSIFYERYLQDQDISRACFFAQEFTAGQLQVVLSRRAKHGTVGNALYEVFPKGDHTSDSFLVDISEAEGCVAELGVPRESFLHVLSRKIRLHQKIFDAPRERAVLPIGPYVGILSWHNARDIITCHAVLRMKPGITQDASDIWAVLAVQYNDNAIERYRLRDQPAAPQNYRDLVRSIHVYRHSYDMLDSSERWIPALMEHVSEQYRLTKSIMSANLDMAERKIASEDFASAVFHLECVLSAQHDLLDALTDALTISPQKT